MTIASGSFEVKLTPQTPGEQTSQANIGRLAIDKHFSGDLEASSLGEMLSVMGGVPDSAGYVAIERVSGKLNGRSGSFALQHTGVMTRGAPQLSILVIPDSGTEELASISGSMGIDIIDGNHSYRFEYTLSDQP